MFLRAGTANVRKAANKPDATTADNRTRSAPSPKEAQNDS